MITINVDGQSVVWLSNEDAEAFGDLLLLCHGASTTDVAKLLETSMRRLGPGALDPLLVYRLKGNIQTLQGMPGTVEVEAC